MCSVLSHAFLFFSYHHCPHLCPRYAPVVCSHCMLTTFILLGPPHLNLLPPNDDNATLKILPPTLSLCYIKWHWTSRMPPLPCHSAMLRMPTPTHSALPHQTASNVKDFAPLLCHGRWDQVPRPSQSHHPRLLNHHQHCWHILTTTPRCGPPTTLASLHTCLTATNAADTSPSNPPSQPLSMQCPLLSSKGCIPCVIFNHLKPATNADAKTPMPNPHEPLLLLRDVG